MTEKTNWKIQINDGEIHDFETKTGIYKLAAVAALSFFEYPETKIEVENRKIDIVKIWVEELIPEYGPYFYGFDGSILYQAIYRNNDWTFIYS